MKSNEAKKVNYLLIGHIETRFGDPISSININSNFCIVGTMMGKLLLYNINKRQLMVLIENKRKIEKEWMMQKMKKKIEKKLKKNWRKWIMNTWKKFTCVVLKKLEDEIVKMKNKDIPKLIPKTNPKKKMK